MKTIKSIEVKQNKLTLFETDNKEFLVKWEKSDKVIESPLYSELSEALETFSNWEAIDKRK